MQYACVHEQHSLRHDMKTQKMKLNQVKEEDVNDERSEGHFTSETGRRAYVYLLMSSSDSSVSDQLSKPRHRVRASQLRVHLCVCEWKCVREDKKTRGQRDRERERQTFCWRRHGQRNKQEETWDVFLCQTPDNEDVMFFLSAVNPINHPTQRRRSM